MKLGLLQKDFQNYLRKFNEENKHIEENGFKKINPFSRLIQEDAKLSALERMEIYLQSYRWRLFEILRGDYPKLKFLMGEDEFNTLCDQYLYYFPSSHCSIRYFGQHLSLFLQEHLPYPNTPYLEEMAKFEWALGLSLDALNSLDALEPRQMSFPGSSLRAVAKQSRKTRDTEEYSFSALKNFSPEDFSNLKIHFHPAVQCISFYWNVPEIWQELERGNLANPPLLQKNPIPIPFLFYRANLSSAFRPMTINECRALKLFQEGKDIAGVCEVLCNTMHETKIPAFIIQCLQQWDSEGLTTN